MKAAIYLEIHKYLNQILEKSLELSLHNVLAIVARNNNAIGEELNLDYGSLCFSK